MSIDRKLWIPPFTNSLPALPCCVCQIGFLNIAPDRLKAMETGPSEDSQSHDAWEVEWVDFSLHRILPLHESAMPTRGRGRRQGGLQIRLRVSSKR